MPRASWRGFLRLSLVSCPSYLSPATSRTKPTRLHQVWRPVPAEEADDPPLVKGRAFLYRSAQGFSEDIYEEADQTPAATRITLRPHDPSTGEEVEKTEVVKGYEYQRGQFVTFTAEEMKALDVESSKVIDLEKFVPRCDIDPVYFDSPYYLYPDGPIAVETLRVIGAAMAEAGVVGLGRLAQVAPGDLDIAIFGQLAPSELPLSDALEARPLQVIGFDTALGYRPLRQ
jgi:DNA end-binding protein Ku